MVRFFVLSLAMILLCPGVALAKAPPLPLPVPDHEWRPLYECVDPDLQSRLQNTLRRHKGWQRLIDKKKMAVGVVDLSDPKRPSFARVNGRAMMYAASLPKIAVLLAAYVCFEDGTLQETPEIQADLSAMIRISSNQAATRLIELIGFQKIEAVLRDPRFELYDEKRGGGLWVGKCYAKKGARYLEPLTGLCHAATVTQVCRFYYLLATGKIISPQRSREMLNILSDPGLHHKFVHSLEKRAPRARLFRKSGTWKTWHSDSVLVWGEVWRRYILASMVESHEGEQILRDLVPAVEQVLLTSSSIADGP